MQGVIEKGFMTCQKSLSHEPMLARKRKKKTTFKNRTTRSTIKSRTIIYYAADPCTRTLLLIIYFSVVIDGTCRRQVLSGQDNCLPIQSLLIFLQ